MMSTWHPMTDTRYFAGFGDGASMAAAFAAVRPNYVTAMYLKDADMDSKVRQQASGMAVPVWLEDSSVCVRDYFLEANQVEGNPEVTLLENLRNPSQRVIQKAVGEAFWEQIWSQLFAKTRRVNTCPEGDCCDRTDLTAEGFQWFVDDCSVDGTPHTWLIHVPKIVREHEAAKVPVVFFYHGGSDNPAEAAEMSRFHEIGEREGFITVYPWGTNRVSWNMELDPDLEDDLSFCRDLILYMTEHYPIDRQRVYLSGFSNGAGMAQTVAMIYPELVAALGHMDSNWPGARFGYSEVDYQNITPMRIALEKKQQYDWRMPVWYTYGTREVSSPVYRGCSQQHQYDFWKRYNHIPVKETRPLDDPACLEHGVDGDSNETLYPDPRYPKRYYTVQRFFSTDEHSQNLYNFALMHDKGHEVATKDAELAWNYMKQYRRNEDGTACLI
jgi:poly(3-hydroxybutyrate) depolymerase